MSGEANQPDSRSSVLPRAYSWLMTLWIGYVFFAFFVIRILGSSTGQRLISFVKFRLSR